MPVHSRRRLLHGAVALLTGFAGCSDSTTSHSSVPPDRPENVERDPDAVALRAPEKDATLAWLPSDGAEANNESSGATPPEDGLHRRLIASRETADRLRFADAADAGDAGDARKFVGGTDFESETLYVENRGVRECFTLELCYLTWSATEVRTQYGSNYRDAEVSCRADAEDATTWLIRVPDTLDPDAVSSYGSGWSSNGCRYPPYLRTTTASGIDPATNRSDSTGDHSDSTGDRSEPSATRSETEAAR